MHGFTVVVSLAFLAVSNAAFAQNQDEEPKVRRPDPEKGLVLAQRWCTSCHVVSSTQSKAIDGVVSFEAIAQRENFNADRLAFFLLNPHPVMPNMSLSRDEARDLAAYIGRLKK